MPLILVENGAHKGRSRRLDPPGPYVIGRDPAVEIHVPDPMASRRHCLIELKDGAFLLRDLGSSNGTLVNGQKLEEHPLKAGDRILAGETLLTFLGEDSKDPLAGRRLKGYEIMERVGRGGMGTVYRARQTSLERCVALKVLSPELVEDPNFVEKFIEEARSAGRLSHPNIVMVYDIDDDVLDGQRIVYYSMEFMGGGSVEDLLNRQGPLPTQKALEFALETARGLQYAEQVGLVHRDIKPGNLMIHENGSIKIGDLGIATRSSRTGSLASQKGGVSGSPHYISPEQARGQDLDSRADFYSLGASIYQMLTGKTPFSGTTLKDLLLKHVKEPAPDLAAVLPGLLPPAVPALVARLLEKNRDLRPASARQLILAIEDAIGSLQAPAEPPRPSRQWRISLHAIIAAAVTVAVLGSLAGGIALTARWVRHRAAEAVLRSDIEGLQKSFERQGGVNLQELETDLQRVEGNPLALGSGGFRDSVEDIRRRLETLKQERRARMEKEASAAKALAGIRAGIPEDLASIGSLKALEALLQPLEVFRKEQAGTPAATEAALEISRIREALRTLEQKHRRAEDALRSHLIPAETFLASTPPRFREALTRFREAPLEIQGTPSEDSLRERIAEVTARMVLEARTWAADALKASDAGRSEKAAADLEKLKDRVEGEALDVLEAALKRIRQDESGSGGGEKKQE